MTRSFAVGTDMPVPAPVSLQPLKEIIGSTYIDPPGEAAQFGSRPRIARFAQERGAWPKRISCFDPCSLTALAHAGGADVLRIGTHNHDHGEAIQMLIQQKGTGKPPEFGHAPSGWKAHA